MAVAKDFLDGVAAISDSVDRVAAKIDELKVANVNALSEAEVADVKKSLGDVKAKLDALTV